MDAIRKLVALRRRVGLYDFLSDLCYSAADRAGRRGDVPLTAVWLTRSWRWRREGERRKKGGVQ